MGDREGGWPLYKATPLCNKKFQDAGVGTAASSPTRRILSPFASPPKTPETRVGGWKRKERGDRGLMIRLYQSLREHPWP